MFFSELIGLSYFRPKQLAMQTLAYTKIPACYMKQYNVSQDKYFLRGLLILHFVFALKIFPAYVQCSPDHNQVRKLVIIKKDLFLESIKTFTYFTV
jgi:hypothetical protein